jgi:hypothetical protein
MGKEGEGRQRGMGSSSPDFLVQYLLSSPHLTSPVEVGTPPLRFYRPAAPPPRIDSRRRDPLATARVGTAAGGRSSRWRRAGPAGGAYDGERAVSLRLLLLNLDGVARAPQCQLKGIVAVASYGGRMAEHDRRAQPPPCSAPRAMDQNPDQIRQVQSRRGRNGRRTF